MSPVTDRIFLERVREGDREREAARSGSVGGFADREGVRLVALALKKDQQMRAMSGTNMPKQQVNEQHRQQTRGR